MTRIDVTDLGAAGDVRAMIGSPTPRPFRLAPLALVGLSTLIGCTPKAGDVGELSSGTTSDTDTDTDTDVAVGGSTGEDSGDAGSGAPAGVPCAADEDRDSVPIGDDNAPGLFNPDQGDVDADGIADLIDPCPTVAGNSADADHDGLGNACDACEAAAFAPIAGVADYMQVRSIPATGDVDGDGIGDTCDNCIHVPNCGAYDASMPWRPGDPSSLGDPTSCQQDADGDGIGDACAGQQLPGAAGPVGLDDDDDFDQDGLRNIADACPRIPELDVIACTSDNECPSARPCDIADGRCGHRDIDADGIGDACDTCATAANPLQVSDPTDDPDGDFIGSVCETGSDPWSCDERANPPPISFYPVSVNGWCCTTQVERFGGLLPSDPDGVPITEDCTAMQEQLGQCRVLPPSALAVPGLIVLPPGCDDALAEAGLTVTTHNHIPLDTEPDQMWASACRVPSLDQDFDGIADTCDLCPFAFDPNNAPYADDNGSLWPNDGKYCNGAYAPSRTCNP